jgi:hypothetical protein
MVMTLKPGISLVYEIVTRSCIEGHEPDTEQLSRSGTKSDVCSRKMVYCRL